MVTMMPVDLPLKLDAFNSKIRRFTVKCTVKYVSLHLNHCTMRRFTAKRTVFLQFNYRKFTVKCFT